MMYYNYIIFILCIYCAPVHGYWLSNPLSSVREKLPTIPPLPIGAQKNSTSNSWELGDSPIITLNTHRGSITVYSHQKTTTELTTVKRGSSRAIKNTPVAITTHKNTVTVTTDSSCPTPWHVSSQQCAHVHYILSVPEQASLQLTIGDGTVSTNNHQGDQKIKSIHHSTIKIQNPGGPLEVKAVRGAVLVNAPRDSITIETTRAPVTVINACSNTTIGTDSGAIKISFPALDPETISRLTSRTGSLYVTLPGDSNAQLIARAPHGRIECHLPITLVEHPMVLHRRAVKELLRSIEGTIGSGGAELTFATQHGNIIIMPKADK